MLKKKKIIFIFFIFNINIFSEVFKLKIIVKKIEKKNSIIKNLIKFFIKVKLINIFFKNFKKKTKLFEFNKDEYNNNFSNFKNYFKYFMGNDNNNGIEKLNKELDEKNKSFQNAEEEYKNKLNQKEIELENLKIKFEEIDEKLNLKLKNLEEKNKIKLNENKELNEKNQSFQNSEEEYKNKLKEKEIKLNEKTKQVEEKTNELENLNIKLDKINEGFNLKLKNLENNLNNFDLKEEKMKLENEITILNSNLLFLQSKIDNMTYNLRFNGFQEMEINKFLNKNYKDAVKKTEEELKIKEEHIEKLNLLLKKFFIYNEEVVIQILDQKNDCENSCKDIFYSKL